MLTGLAITLLLILALLAIPVALTFRVSWPEGHRNDFKLQWAFGLVCISIPASPAEDDKQKTDRKERSSRQGRNFFAAVREKTFRRRIFRFVSDLWRAVHKEEVSLRIRLGLGDPADTGQLWALIGPMAGAFATVREASIQIEPEFFETAFEIDSSGSIRLVPLQIIWLALALLLSPSIWFGIWQTRQAGA